MQIENAKKELIKNQNKAVILGMWCFKLYMIFFAFLLGMTIKPSNKANVAEYAMRK